MDGSKADRRDAAVNLVPVVVGKGDVELALVLGAVTVGVADQRGFVLQDRVSTDEALGVSVALLSDLRGRGSGCC